MPLDPSLPLQIQPFQAPDPLKAASQVYTLKQMQEQQALLPLQRQQMMQQVQHGQLQNQGLQEGLDEKQALRSAYTYKPSGEIDYEQTAQKLAAAGKPQLVPALMADRRKQEGDAAEQAKKQADASKSAAEAKNAWVEHIVSPAMAFYQSEFEKAGDGPGSDVKKQAILKQAHDHYHQIAAQSNGVLPDVPGELRPEGLKQLANISQEAYKKRLEAGQPTAFQKEVTAAGLPPAQQQKALQDKITHDTTYPPQITIMQTPSGGLASVEAKSGTKPTVTPIKGSEGLTKPASGDATQSAIPPEHANLHGDDYLKTLPTGVASAVKAIAEGRANLGSLSTKGGHREAMLERAAQYDPTFDATKFPARQAVVKDFTSGSSAKNVTAINTGIHHMGTMLDLANALNNRDTKVLNSVFNRIGTETGQSNVNNFNIAKQAVANELMRVFRVVGASESEVKSWESNFSSAASPKQLRDGIQVAGTLLKARIDALNDQWNRGMDTDKGYPRLLSDESKDVLKKLGVPTGGRDVGVKAPGDQKVYKKYNPDTGRIE